MGQKTKQILMRQKEYLGQKLVDRKAFLAEKGMDAPKADNDTLVRKLKARVKAVDTRLRVIAASEKRKVELAQIKADRAAAPKEAQEVKKAEKPKKGTEGAKEKKPKAEKKPAAPKEPKEPKEPKSVPNPAPAESPEEKKAPAKE